jgi:hypothetical protein
VQKAILNLEITMRSFTISFLAFGATAALSTVASATTLTFDALNLLNYGAIPTNLGSNASSPGAGYVMGAGWTPDVAVSMSTVDSFGALLNGNLSYWNQQYGDLTDVAFPVSSGNYARITLSASGGNTVTINSFDLGGYLTNSLNATRIRVLDSSGNILWNQDNTTVNGTGPSHSSYLPAITAQSLTLEWGDSWNIGLDNLNFTQSTVPEPASVAFLSLGALALIKRRRSR